MIRKIMLFRRDNFKGLIISENDENDVAELVNNF